MAEASGDLEEPLADDASQRRRTWPRVLLAIALAVLVAVFGLWLARDRIAGNVIEAQLRKYDIPATYTIERVAPDRQVLTNIVVGDPGSPDLTVDRAEVAILYRLGSPRIGRITLVRPRLYGAVRGGRLTFGTLDKVLFRKTGKPPGLPEVDVRLIDGRALIASDYGRVAMKADGGGRIDSGFSGIVALTAPQLDGEGCSARGATLYGKLITSGGRPTIDGPLRAKSVRCAARGLAMNDAVMSLRVVVDAGFRGAEGRAKLAVGAIAAGATHARDLAGSTRAIWRAGALTANFDLTAHELVHPQVLVADIAAEGSVRARNGFEKLVLQTDLAAKGMSLGIGLDRAIADAARSADGTLLTPLLSQARTALARETRASSFTARLTARRNAEALTLLVPSAAVRGTSGDTLIALSQFAVTRTGSGTPRFSGNVSTGGEGLPRIAGRMERAAAGKAVLRLRMAPYASSGSSLAIPEFVIAQAPSGALGFAGHAEASGPLPGGSARNLSLPLQGSYAAGRLSLWTRCMDVGFDRLSVASLTFDRRKLTICPSRGRPILQHDSGGLRIAAGAPSLDLSGRLAETQVRLRSGPVGFAYPGAMSARKVDVSLGPTATASTFRIDTLSATFGREIAGTFDNADVKLFQVPLNLENTSGNWRYAGGTLGIADGKFRLVDRQQQPRFNPLVSEGARLTLERNVINAQATLAEPKTGRVVTRLAILHDLSTGRGRADLSVPGILFDSQLQPDTLFPLAKGVVANAAGTVTGTGRIEWNAKGVTSRGTFGSGNLDFAAAFGPVKGASGTVEFSDLLDLTTVAGQKIRFASVNPGIEVTDGELFFGLRGGRTLTVEGATWPFMGGTLTLRGTTLNLGTSEERRYVFEIAGLEAAQFVERMQLNNMQATGTFDGTIPIVFDAAGNGRIEGGLLIARAPGGNVSYVGELNRQDLGTMANFAFDALKSLDYKQMSVAMDGNLTGEIVTRVRFDGVKQGAGTKQNFITRRFANLPIRFNVNIRAPFYQLITSIKSMYDPASVRDPRTLGLVDDDGTILKRVAVPQAPVIIPDTINPEPTPIQTPESEKKP